MYITDLTHFLDESGAIAPIKGAARAMAQFLVDVVARATDNSDASLAAPTCFKCKKGPVTAVRAADDAVEGQPPDHLAELTPNLGGSYTLLADDARQRRHLPGIEHADAADELRAFALGLDLDRHHVRLAGALDAVELDARVPHRRAVGRNLHREQALHQAEQAVDHFRFRKIFLHFLGRLLQCHQEMLLCTNPS